MIDFTEIKKLDALLKAANIPHTIGPLYDGAQIRMYADKEMKKELDDAVIHRYSYGASKGLLETYRLNSCAGWESAKEVFEGWEEMFKDWKEMFEKGLTNQE